MTINEYQELAYDKALPQCKNIIYMLVGLGNEAGETLGKYKKVLRGDYSLEDVREKLIDELADTCWYISGTLKELNCTLEEALQRNIDKLTDRVERGVIQGNGDTR